MNSTENQIMNTKYYSYVINKLRDFFLKKGFIESQCQQSQTILSACEDVNTITTYCYGNTLFPMIQTNQMILEDLLLNFPDVPGYFCTTTSYRYEPNPIEGRHQRVFGMFEFELHGDINDLQKLEIELLEHLGYDVNKFTEGNYFDVAKHYETDEISHEYEQKIYEDHGAVFFLKNFPEYTSPFWNMNRNHKNGTANKIDVILSGMETIGSAERSCDVEDMRNRFKTISEGKYAQILYDKFGKERVDAELEEFLAHKFIVRSGGGIGISRLISSMLKEGLIPKYEPILQQTL